MCYTKKPLLNFLPSLFTVKKQPKFTMKTIIDTDNLLSKILKLLVSSFAFLLVALLTAIAGYSLAYPNFSIKTLKYQDIFIIITYILLLWPYYASRQGLLERHLQDAKKTIDEDAIKYGLSIPGYLFILVAVIAFFTFDKFYTPSKYNFYGEWQDVIINLFLALIPFLFVTLSSLQRLSSNNYDKAFEFSERVLFPALCTGIVPFAFGWSVAHQPIDLKITLLGTSYVVLLMIIARIQMSKELLRVATAIIVVLISFLVFQQEDISIILFGTVITLAMSVSEASKRVHQANAQDRYYPSYQGVKYYLAGSNWGGIVFLWLLILVPLFADALPTWPILLFIALQSITWFFVTSTYKKRRSASVLALLFGYGLPIVIILVNAFDLPVTLLSHSIAPANAGAVFGLILATLGLLVFGDDFLKYIRSTEKLKVDTYLYEKNNYYLFFVVLTTIVLITSFAGTFTENEIVKTKASEIIGFCIIIFSFLSTVFLFTHPEGNSNMNKENKSTESNMLDNTEKTNLKKEIKYALITARPITAIVAGLLMFVLLAGDNQHPVWKDILLSIPIVLTTMVGFILNDIFDYKKDVQAEVKKPIAMGQLKRERAVIYIIGLTSLALLIEGIVNKYSSIVILLSTLLGVFFYSPLSKRIPILKGVATAALTLTPIIYASSVLKIQIPYFVYLTILGFIFGREILLDIKDYQGDLQHGIKTIVAYLEIPKSRILSWSLMFISVLYYLSKLSSPYSVTLGLLGLTALIVAFIQDRNNQIKNGGITIIAMIFCVLALPFTLP